MMFRCPKDYVLTLGVAARFLLKAQKKALPELYSALQGSAIRGGTFYLFKALALLGKETERDELWTKDGTELPLSLEVERTLLPHSDPETSWFLKLTPLIGRSTPTHSAGTRVHRHGIVSTS